MGRAREQNLFSAKVLSVPDFPTSQFEVEWFPPPWSCVRRLSLLGDRQKRDWSGHKLDPFLRSELELASTKRNLLVRRTARSCQKTENAQSLSKRDLFIEGNPAISYYVGSSKCPVVFWTESSYFEVSFQNNFLQNKCRREGWRVQSFGWRVCKLTVETCFLCFRRTFGNIYYEGETCACCSLLFIFLQIETCSNSFSCFYFRLDLCKFEWFSVISWNTKFNLERS